MSGSRTTTEGDELLPNIHPGEILREDFLIGGEIPVQEVASGSGIDAAELAALLDERRDVDANTDIRLARYFGTSEGFFLGLQADHDLEAERRKHSAEFARIVRRAA